MLYIGFGKYATQTSDAAVMAGGKSINKIMFFTLLMSSSPRKFLYKKY